MEKKLIFVVEDETAYGNILKNKLEKEGYDVVLIRNGKEVFEFAKTKKPQLIILDLILPGKNGFEILSEIKKDKELCDIKVIILSNLGQNEDKEKTLALGANGYLVKSDETFYDVIEKINKLLV